MLARIAGKIERNVAYRRLMADAARLPSPPFDPGRVGKILVPLYAGIGNIVLYGPAIRAIRRRYADAEIVAAVGTNRRNEEVLGPDIIDRVIHIPLEATTAQRKEDHVRLRDERFDLCVNSFHVAQPEHAAFTVAAGIAWRCGHVSSPGWRSPYDAIYNLPARMQRDEHEVDRYLHLARAVGARDEDIDPEPFFVVSAAANDEAAALLASKGCGTNLVAVHAGTSVVMRWKQWGIDRFASVVQRLAAGDPSLTFVMVGAPDEREEQQATLDILSRDLGARFVDLVGATGVQQLAAVLARSRCLVGNDSGPMQIAAALGVPVIVPWGPSDLPRNRPRDPRHTVLFQNLPCSPCYRMPGDSSVHLCNDHVCLSTIGVDDVTKAVRATLDRSRSATAE